ncbi:MFS general substrate transporter [Pseudovirgaria hyperparasitica]|uniref:MFS general substrate transporter n=1 Tax=Pseudovirgaria hyperparasitica TaxID=470096 RepID=A0A6A6W229_9PEZI|nr:MFS general substrate transporter [Pseudovirgaria hyperparasitica]KAF2755071.1 MFS general substrate transporter [Pseudovirgaria hyperparasitica]
MPPKSIMSDGHSTETSPLLSKDSSQTINPNVLDCRVGITTETSQSVVRNTANAESYSPHTRDVENQSGYEVQKSQQHQGLPEVRKRLKYIIPAVAIGVFLAAADQTVIVSSYGLIGTDLKALNKTSWIATAYMLTLTSFQPLYGKLSDIFGRKACLIFAYTVFGIGCLCCGLARDINELIAARALAGIGGGGMTALVSILLSDIVTLRERGKWQGYINIIYASGAATGAPVGGILADYVGWRWAFNVQPPLCLISIIAVSLALKLPRHNRGSWKAKVLRIDFFGAIILITAISAFLIALDRGSNQSWKDKWTIVSLAISLPLFALFILVESKVAAEPFAPGHIIFRRSMFAGYLVNFFAFGGWLGALFYIPLHFQVVNDLSATEASLRLIPSIVCGVSGSLTAGFYMQRTGKYYWLTVMCYTNLTIGMSVVLLCSGILFNSVPGIMVGMCICAFSNGIGVTTSLIALIANCTYEDQAVVTACSYLFRSLGSVFGMCISASITNSTLRTSLMHALSNGKDGERIAEGVRHSLAYIRTLEPSLRELVRSCYGLSTRSAFGFQVALVMGATVSAVFIKEKALGT